jgi:capsular polysaccharide export protein
MDGRSQRPFAAVGAAGGPAAPPRTVLILQGPAAPFFRRLAAALEAGGARVVKVNICGGDAAFWRRPAISFRGRLPEWRGFVAGVIEAERVTDVVLFGDCRPHHVVAVNLARQHGLRLHLFEEGYLRPGWITCEPWGVNGHSDLPRRPATILAMAQRLDPTPEAAPAPSYFLHRAVWDVMWTAGLIGRMPLFPHYRHHALDHPLVEYVGWLGRFFRAPWARRQARQVMDRLGGERGPYYLHALQLDTDFQIRTHSRYRDTLEAAAEIIASFARHADRSARLVVKLHPLDVRPLLKRRRIEELAVAHGVADRVDFIDGGDLQQLVDGARGLIVVNSTVGQFAMERGKPVKVLGTAVFDLPGLAFQGELDRFWAEGQPPRRDLLEAFRRVVVARTQIRGSFFSLRGIDLAVDGASRRILGDTIRPLQETVARIVETA